MRVLVTGATGYIGSVVCEKLHAHGHAVRGLARSDEASAKLDAHRVSAFRGSLRDAAAIAEAARAFDAVIHTAMEWSAEAGAIDRTFVETVVPTMYGTGKAFIYTSGCWLMGDTKGRVAGEMFPIKPPAFAAWRPAVEQIALDTTGRQMRGMVIRPTMVYGRKGGLIAAFVSGKMPLVGDGSNHWSFVHVDDLAEMFVLALEKAPAGSLYLAAAGKPLTVRQVAEAARLSTFVPVEEARPQIGPMVDGLVLDQQIGSTRASRELGWRPRGPSVLDEIRDGYFS